MRNLLRTTMISGVGVLMALSAAPASAAQAPAGTPSSHDFAMIRDVVAGQSTLDRLAGTAFPHSPTVRPEVAARTAETDSTTLVPVYEPTAEFVTGQSSTPARLAYVAAPATTGNGSEATVWAHREGGSWKVYNVASGDLEKRLAARAGDGYLLHEPQVNAWYSVQGDTVTVLDGSVTNAASGSTMTVDAYRSVLHDRYADKLPGSAYDRSGAAGGYAQQAAAPRDFDTSVRPVLPGGVLAVLLAAGAFTLPRLRRR